MSSIWYICSQRSARQVKHNHVPIKRRNKDTVDNHHAVIIQIGSKLLTLTKAQSLRSAGAFARSGSG